MKRLSLTAVVAACALALAGCGSSAHTTTVHAIPAPQAACPPGQSFMGCASGVAALPNQLPPSGLGLTRPVSGCVYPDVSSFQGHPDWRTASERICAAATKAGESFTEDPDFEFNVAQFRALHIPWAPYWFIRGCSEGNAYVQILNQVHFRDDPLALKPVLDMEVPAAAGCAVPIAAAIHHAFGIWPIIYTAPGTWPGGASGGLDVWEADFTLGSLAPLPFHAHVVGWQRYSPPFTFLEIPGLGVIDESLNLGFATDYAFPKPKVICNAFARSIPAACLKLFPNQRFGGLDERGVVSTYKYHRARSVHAHLVFLRNRVWFVAHHKREHGQWAELAKPNWDFRRGFRYQRLAHDAAGR